jgi:hypothetical protein
LHLLGCGDISAIGPTYLTHWDVAETIDVSHIRWRCYQPDAEPKFQRSLCAAAFASADR